MLTDFISSARASICSYLRQFPRRQKIDTAEGCEESVQTSWRLKAPHCSNYCIRTSEAVQRLALAAGSQARGVLERRCRPPWSAASGPAPYTDFVCDRHSADSVCFCAAPSALDSVLHPHPGLTAGATALSRLRRWCQGNTRQMFYLGS